MEPTSDKVQSLIQTLGAGDIAARCAAAEELGEQGAAARAAVPALLRALDDQGSWVCKTWFPGTPWSAQWVAVAYVREKAIRALFKIQPEVLQQARATMVGLLECPSEYSLESDGPVMGVCFSDQEWAAAGGPP